MRQPDLSGRLARWVFKLQPYRFTISHRKGKDHVVPDALSRIPDDISALEIVDPLIDFNSPHFDDSDYVELKGTIMKAPNKYPDIKIVDKYVYYRTEHYSGDESQEQLCWKLWIPHKLRTQLISKAHDSPEASHGGMAKTLDLLRRTFFWPGIVIDVREYVSNCDVCKSTKAPNMTMKPPMGQPAEYPINDLKKIQQSIITQYKNLLVMDDKKVPAEIINISSEELNAEFINLCSDVGGEEEEEDEAKDKKQQTCTTSRRQENPNSSKQADKETDIKPNTSKKADKESAKRPSEASKATEIRLESDDDLEKICVSYPTSTADKAKQPKNNVKGKTNEEEEESSKAKNLDDVTKNLLDQIDMICGEGNLDKTGEKSPTICQENISNENSGFSSKISPAKRQNNKTEAPTADTISLDASSDDEEVNANLIKETVKKVSQQQLGAETPSPVLEEKPRSNVRKSVENHNQTDDHNKTVPSPPAATNAVEEETKSPTDPTIISAHNGISLKSLHNSNCENLQAEHQRKEEEDKKREDLDKPTFEDIEKRNSLKSTEKIRSILLSILQPSEIDALRDSFKNTQKNSSETESETNYGKQNSPKCVDNENTKSLLDGHQKITNLEVREKLPNGMEIDNKSPPPQSSESLNGKVIDCHNTEEEDQRTTPTKKSSKAKKSKKAKSSRPSSSPGGNRKVDITRKMNQVYRELECTFKGFDQIMNYEPKAIDGKRRSSVHSRSVISEQLNVDEEPTTSFQLRKRRKTIGNENTKSFLDGHQKITDLEVSEKLSNGMEIANKSPPPQSSEGLNGKVIDCHTTKEEHQKTTPTKKSSKAKKSKKAKSSRPSSSPGGNRKVDITRKMNQVYRELECTFKGFDQIMNYEPKAIDGKRRSSVHTRSFISEQLNVDEEPTTSFQLRKRRKTIGNENTKSLLDGHQKITDLEVREKLPNGMEINNKSPPPQSSESLNGKVIDCHTTKEEHQRTTPAKKSSKAKKSKKAKSFRPSSSPGN
ncbi:nucleolar and coiled-body phosphoprotein 1-like [Musca domestica]|uniref:RNA-directed DNA polymerase n=1 Tax=Musca domestica TaxID=7370 RepID=A0ABM3UVJ5_MUSDO|nr:nucleolar and coiled-body phosphoprotein 1-like [Musca domestica]